MKHSKVLKTLLIIAGLIGCGIGGALLFIPVTFQASAGIELGNNIDLLSEVRAPGGALLASGILIIAGAFITKLSFTSTIVLTLLYLSYGFSRVIGMAIDGLPSEGFISVTVLEIIIGMIGVFALIKYRQVE